MRKRTTGARWMRSFRTFFEPGQLEAYQAGVMGYRYKGRQCLKSPVDVAIYLHLLEVLRPASIVEIGTREGGSALLLADMAAMVGLAPQVVSVDIAPPAQPPADPRIIFLAGDVHDLAAVFGAGGLRALPGPRLVVEDSAHTRAGCRAALDFFADALDPGDYLVVEDGVIDDLGMSDRFDGGPNRAIADFFAERPDVFEVDEGLCDMFGRNATYSPNGWLRRR
mgnify:CR=1 FL=1